MEDTRLQLINSATERRYKPRALSFIKTQNKYNRRSKHYNKGYFMFLHNFEAFQKYILKIEEKILNLDQNIAKFPEDKELKWIN